MKKFFIDDKKFSYIYIYKDEKKKKYIYIYMYKYKVHSKGYKPHLDFRFVVNLSHLYGPHLYRN